jgi:hypothetical protein
MELTGQQAEADSLIRLLATMRASDGSYYASSTDALPTGIMLETDPSKPRQYFHIAHLAAVSWVAIAERRYHPFVRKSAPP